MLCSRARINDNVTASSAVGGQGAGVSGPGGETTDNLEN